MLSANETTALNQGLLDRIRAEGGSAALSYADITAGRSPERAIRSLDNFLTNQGLPHELINIWENSLVRIWLIDPADRR